MTIKDSAVLYRANINSDWNAVSKLSITVPN
jgi:hypothetical protein